jgi:hypothetical protein
MSSLALLSDHLRKLEDSMNIVCASVREYHDILEAAKPDYADGVNPAEISGVLENIIMKGIAKSINPTTKKGISGGIKPVISRQKGSLLNDVLKKKGKK